jgi:hypothetical protein
MQISHVKRNLVLGRTPDSISRSVVKLAAHTVSHPSILRVHPIYRTPPFSAFTFFIALSAPLPPLPFFQSPLYYSLGFLVFLRA